MMERVQGGVGLKVLLVIVLCVGAMINLIPFLWMVSSSLKSPAQVFAYPPEWIPDPFVWTNYIVGFARINARVFLNSFIFATSVVVLQGIVATMGGFAFARLRFPFRDQIFLLYPATMMIPPQVTMIPTYLVIVRLGWVDSYPGLILPIVASAAFGTFLFRQFFLKIPEELYEAARMDGASYWQQYWRVTLPLSRPVMTAYGIITFLNAWNMFLWPLIVARSPEMRVVPMVIAQLSGQEAPERAITMAATTLSMVPLLILWIFAQRWFIEGISMTGSKG